MKEIGFGVLGCGIIGPLHCKAINKAEGACLVAVSDVDAEKAKKLAAEFGVEGYTDYEEMLKRDDIHAVAICTPTSMHPEQTILAAKYGKHVICEKPMATTLRDAKKMIEACKKHKVKLAVIFQRRAAGIFPAIKKFVDDGRLGKLLMGDAYIKYYRSQGYYNSAGWRGTWEFDGGGALMNQGIHIVDIVQWITGGIESVYGYAETKARDIEVEDTSAVVIRYKNGAIGVIEGATTVCPPMDHRIEIHGTKGTIMVSGEKAVKWSLWTDDEKEINLLKEDEEIRKLTSADHEWCAGHYVQFQDFANAINENKKPTVSGEDGMEALKVVLGIYKSSKTGKKVEIKIGR
jgi:UDP-N-acetyl-2-amino-2-deoxyglucuronate dehydrogenase